MTIILSGDTMACPFCGEPVEEATGKLRMHEASLDGVSVDFQMTCLNCKKIFWQRYYANFDDYVYDNIDDVGEETEYRCPHCGNHVCENNYYDPKAEEGVESYPYVCPYCDENFYGIEVIKDE